MPPRRVVPRAFVLVVVAALTVLPAGSGLLPVGAAQVARADGPNYPTFGSSFPTTFAAVAPAGVVNLAVPASGDEPANPDPASVTAIAGSSPLQGAAILRSDLSGSSLATTTIVSLHLENLPIQIPLSTIPLQRATDPKDWPAALASTPLAGIPLQNVTWAQVSQLTNPPVVLASLTMADIDWSGSALADLPLAAFTFGGADITSIQIPLQPGESSTDASAGERWCYLLNQAQANSCADPASLVGQSLIGISVRGAPLKNIPLKNIPLKNIPLKNIPLKNIDLTTS
ncbi:MAG: hypothetical protein ACRDGQ_11350, partial [Candidatus Limnocylindrales bacterium]